MGLCHSSTLPLVSSIHVLCNAHSASWTSDLVEWRPHTHKTWVTNRRLQFADWGSHMCMSERKVYTLPFVIHMFEPPFTSHTPCLFHLCCVWHPFNQPYPPPPSGWMWVSHTRYGWERRAWMAGWDCIIPWQRYGYIPLPSVTHAVCGTHSTNQTPPLVEWLPHRHTQYGWQREGNSWLNEGRMRVWQRARYVPFSLLSMCLCSCSPAVPIVLSCRTPPLVK